MSCGLKRGFISWCLSVCWDCLGHFGQRVFLALMYQWVLVYFGQIGFIKLINSKKKLEIYSHENWEISILTIKKGRTRFKTFLPLKQDISNFCWCQSTSSRYRLKNWEEKRTKGKRTKANYNKTSNMNNNDNISPIQGPSTVSCMIASYLSQLTHWVHQLPTVGIGWCSQ